MTRQATPDHESNSISDLHEQGGDLTSLLCRKGWRHWLARRIYDSITSYPEGNFYLYGTIALRIRCQLRQVVRIFEA